MSSQDHAVPPDVGACEYATGLRWGVELEGFTREETVDGDRLRVGGDHNPIDFPRSYEGAVFGVSSDSSLEYGDGRGMEFVSPILQGERGAVAMCEFLADRRREGFTVNSTCGVHVHVGLLDYCRAADIPPVTFARIIRRVVYYVRRHALALYGIGGYRARAKGHYARPLRSPEKTAVDTLAGEAVRVAVMAGEDLTMRDVVMHARDCWGSLPSEGKFCAVNLLSLYRHGTIEFRVFAGSADPAAVLAFVQVALAITGRAIAEECRGDMGLTVDLPCWERGGMSAHPNTVDALAALRGWVDYHSDRPWGHFAECDRLPSRRLVAAAMAARAEHAYRSPREPFEESRGDGGSSEDDLCHTCEEAPPEDCSCFNCEGCGTTQPPEEHCGTCERGAECGCCDCVPCYECSEITPQESVCYDDTDGIDRCEACHDGVMDERREAEEAEEADERREAEEGGDNVQA